MQEDSDWRLDPEREGRARRFRRRFRVLDATALTVFVTAWLVTLGPVPAIVALVTAKHVLVAVLLANMTAREQEGREPDPQWGGPEDFPAYR